MSQEDVELVISVFTRGAAPDIEMGEPMRDDEHWDRIGDRFSPDVEEVVDPEDGQNLLLVPRQATFARLTTSRSIRSCACRLRQAM
jgi:broad specificity phosphatase PhoE